MALNFYDSDYKTNILGIPPEFANIEIVDIALEKVYIDNPIHFSVFFKMSSWIFSTFNQNDAIFSYICSIDSIENNRQLVPQLYRKTLFDLLLKRIPDCNNILNMDFEIGDGEYKTYGRIFYKQRHIPIIYAVLDNLKDK